MNMNLLATGLDENLAQIVEKLKGLIDSFWIYIVIALAAVVVIWGAYIGIKIAIAHRNEEKINARDMVKNLIIGIVIIFVVAWARLFSSTVCPLGLAHKNIISERKGGEAFSPPCFQIKEDKC